MDYFEMQIEVNKKQIRGKIDAGIEFSNVYYRRWVNKNRGDFCK